MTDTFLLPPNSTKFERDYEATFMERLDAVESYVDKILDIWRPTACPRDFLFWLAWTLSVEIWDLRWQDNEKRNFLSTSIPVHLQKGTKFSVQKILESMGFNIQIMEWFEYVPSKDPFIFYVIINIEQPELLATGNIKYVKTAIDQTKPVRCKYHLVMGINFIKTTMICTGVGIVQRKIFFTANIQNV